MSLQELSNITGSYVKHVSVPTCSNRHTILSGIIYVSLVSTNNKCARSIYTLKFWVFQFSFPILSLKYSHNTVTTIEIRVQFIGVDPITDNFANVGKQQDTHGNYEDIIRLSTKYFSTVGQRLWLNLYGSVPSKFFLRCLKLKEN